MGTKGSSQLKMCMFVLTVYEYTIRYCNTQVDRAIDKSTKRLLMKQVDTPTVWIMIDASHSCLLFVQIQLGLYTHAHTQTHIQASKYTSMCYKTSPYTLLYVLSYTRVKHFSGILKQIHWTFNVDGTCQRIFFGIESVNNSIFRKSFIPGWSTFELIVEDCLFRFIDWLTKTLSTSYQ